MPSRRTSLISADGTSVPVAPGVTMSAEALALASAGAAAPAPAAAPPAAPATTSTNTSAPAAPAAPAEVALVVAADAAAAAAAPPPSVPGPGGSLPPPTLAAQQVRARQHRQMALLAQEELARRSAEHQHQQRLAAATAAVPGVSAARVGALSPGALAAGVDIAGHGLPPPSSLALPPGAASAAGAAAGGIGGPRSALEARQLREMAAVEMELRQLRQMQAVQQRAFERDQVQRQQLRAAAVATGGGNPPPAAHHHHPPHAAAAAAAAHHRHHLAGLGRGVGVGVGVGSALTGTLGGGLGGHGRGAAGAVAGLAGLGGGLIERPSSAGPLGAAANLLRHVGGSPPLRGIAAGAGVGAGAGAGAPGTTSTPGAATAALAGAKLKRPHSAGPLGFMADLMDETGDGVGTSRADAGGAAAGAGTATAGTGAGAGDSRDAPGIPRRHSAGALQTFTDLLNDADSDEDDDDDDKPTSAGSSTKISGVHAESGDDAILSPRIAAAQARVEALEKQLELVRRQQQVRAKAIGVGVPKAGAGAAGSPPAAAAAPTGSAASTDPAVAPHIAAAQARADALEKKLAQQKELQHGIQEELLQLRDAEAPDARIAAAQARVDALEKQLADGAAAKEGAAAAGEAEAPAVPAATAAPVVAAAVAPETAEAQAVASVATVPAAALAALPFQRLDSNPRRPTRNSGFPLPLMSTKDDKYVPPKIKSLDGFRAAFAKMRANMKSKSNKRKASEISSAGNAGGAEENDKSTVVDDKIPLPEATFNGDIFSNMIYRGKIDLTEQDWTVTGMYSINEKSKAAEKIRQYQAEQILLQKVEAAKAEAAAVRAASEAAAVAAPVAPGTQPTKRKKGWTAEQEQMIAELKRQKAELDEKLARHQATKSKEKTAPSPAPKPALGGGSLLPPILPNAAIVIPKAPADPSTGSGPTQDANKEAEETINEPEQEASRALPPASVKTSDIRPLVSNEAMGAASTLLDLMPRVAKNESAAGDEKVQIQDHQTEPEKDSKMGLENGTKRSSEEMAGESTMDRGPLSPNSEDKMMTDLQTMGKRKKARRLTPPGGETSAPNALVGAGEKVEEEAKTVAVSDTGGSVVAGAETGGFVSNGSN